MKLVTLDGRIMAPGKEHDYVLNDGVPVFHGDHRVHHDSVVQVIDLESGVRRVLIGPGMAEVSHDSDG